MIDVDHLVIATPLDDFEDGVGCAGCGLQMHEEACWDGRNSHYCEPCMTALLEAYAIESEAFARRHCELTEPLPLYDEALEHRPTREEFEAGDREAYSPNSYARHCRHNCSNYDKMIVNLDRDSPLDQVRYLAIRDRIELLLEEALESDESDQED